MTEFVWLMSSEERQQDSCHPCNPSNDIVIAPQMSINRMSISSCELATIEFPRTQTLIEPCWSRIYTFRGMLVDRERKIEVETPRGTFCAELPMTFNRILRVIGTDNPIFETQYPHLLPSFGAQVVGMEQAVEGPFQVLSSTQFQALGTNLKTTKVNSATALYSPPEPSPIFVAARLTKQLNDEFRAKTNCNECAFLIQWNPQFSRFSIELVCKSLREVYLNVTCASLDLGFSKGRHPLHLDRQYASFEPQGTSFVSLTSGNYTLDEMLEEINFQFNICYLATSYRLSIWRDELQTITIPPGSYTPHSLAETVTQLLQADITLEYDDCENKYVFQSASDFNLEFEDSTSSPNKAPNLCFKLGFRAARFTNERKYVAQDVVYPQRVLNTNYNTNICTAQVDPDFNRIVLFFARPMPVTASIFNYEDRPEVWRVCSDVAVGVQVNDVVEISVAGKHVRVRVAAVLCGTEFLVDAPVNVTVSRDGLRCSVRIIGPPTQSVFVHGQFAVKPLILGFGDCDLLYGCESFLRAPFVYNLNPFTFVLLEIVEPQNASTHIEHRYCNDHKTSILAKIVLNFEPQMERFYPCVATFFSGTRLTRFHFRILNEDHSLYQLKGQNWRATFRLIHEPADATRVLNSPFLKA